jgi:hypothetical protein
MATQRYISTSFWDDEWIQTLDPSEKLLYLYLMTNPLTNIAGVYKITDRRISFDTGFNLDTITHIFRKFEKAEKVYRKGEYIALPSWPKHQKWDKSTKVKEGIDRILKELEPEIIMFLKQIGYRYPIDTLSIPYGYPPNYSYLDFNSDSDLKPEGCSELPQKSESIEADKPPKDDKPKAESLPASPVYCTIITNTGWEYPITEDLVEMWKTTFPAVNIEQQLLSMKSWSVTHPKNRKTKGGMLAFVNNWLSREQNRAGDTRSRQVKRFATETGSLQTSPDDYNSL